MSEKTTDPKKAPREQAHAPPQQEEDLQQDPSSESLDSLLSGTSPPLQPKDSIQLQRTIGNRATQQLINQRRSQRVPTVQRSGGDSASDDGDESLQHEALVTLLEQIPVETPQQVNAAENMFSHVITIASDVASNAGETASQGAVASGSLGLLASPLNVHSLIQVMQSGHYEEAATPIIALIGDTAMAVHVLTEAAISMGAISSTSGLASIGNIAGMMGGATFAFTVSAQIMIEVFSIPGDANENLWKIFFLADASGILTAWIFNDDSISPHQRLRPELRNGGLWDEDLTGALDAAHQRAHTLWQEEFHEQPEKIRQARQSANDNPEVFWRMMGAQMEQALRPTPNGIGVAIINDLIHDANDARERLRRQERARRRQPRGNYVEIGGQVMYIPPATTD